MVMVCYRSTSVLVVLHLSQFYQWACSRCMDLILRGVDVSNLRTVSARRRRRTTTVCSTRGSNPGPCPKMKLGASTAKAIPLVVESTIQNIRPNVNIIRKIQKLSQIDSGMLSPGRARSCESRTVLILKNRSFLPEIAPPETP